MGPGLLGASGSAWESGATVPRMSVGGTCGTVLKSSPPSVRAETGGASTWRDINGMSGTSRRKTRKARCRETFLRSNPGLNSTGSTSARTNSQPFDAPSFICSVKPCAIRDKLSRTRRTRVGLCVAGTTLYSYCIVFTGTLSSFANLGHHARLAHDGSTLKHVALPLTHDPSLILTNLLTAFGFALPSVAFMTWPTNHPATFGFALAFST